MAKKVQAMVKLQINAGKATPAPPVGTALGPHGGNIDVQEVTPGNTIMFRVNQKGAHLFLGDCHAAQGDGRLRQLVDARRDGGSRPGVVREAGRVQQHDRSRHSTSVL